MSRRRVTLGALILVLGLGGDLFAQVAARTELPSDVMLGRLGLQRAWWAHASIDSSRDRLKYFISDERITLAQSETGMVSAFDNANGHRLWAVQVGDPHEVRFRAVTNDHLVLLISGANMYALNKFTGDVAWMVKVPTAVSTPPGLDETRAYVGTISGTVYAYDLVFLEKLSKDPRLAADMYHSLKWQYKTGADHVSADQHGKGRGCGECRCFAVRPGRGQPEVAFSVRDGPAPFGTDHADRQTDLRGDRGPQGLLPRRGVGRAQVGAAFGVADPANAARGGGPRLPAA